MESEIESDLPTLCYDMISVSSSLRRTSQATGLLPKECSRNVSAGLSPQKHLSQHLPQHLPCYRLMRASPCLWERQWRGTLRRWCCWSTWGGITSRLRPHGGETD
jgi:hypothetical protein